MNISVTTEAGVNTSEAVSLDSFIQYRVSLWLTYYVTPIIIILGTFGNVMTIVIMRRTSTGDSVTNILFTALAITDLISLHSTALISWMQYTFNWTFQNISSVSCKFHVWISTGSGTVGAWILVLLTFHRAMAVVWPHRVNVLCNRRKIYVAIGVITVFLSLLYSHYIYGFDLVLRNNSTGPDCYYVSAEYLHFVDSVFTYIELLVFSVVPFSCLALSNSVLVWKLTVSVREARQRLTPGNTEQFETRNKAANSVTLTVIIVSLIFIILTLPNGLYLTVFWALFDDQTLRGIAEGYLYNTIIFLMLYCNMAVNFYLYCLTGRRFRQESYNILRCGRREATVNSSSHRNQPSASTSTDTTGIN